MDSGSGTDSSHTATALLSQDSQSRMSQDRSHVVQPYRSSRMRGLWRRLSELVARPRRSEERLPVAVDRLRFHPCDFAHYDADGRRIANDVLRLLYRHPEPTIGRSGPRSPEGTWPVGDTFTRPLPGDSDTLGDCTSPAARHSD